MNYILTERCLLIFYDNKVIVNKVSKSKGLEITMWLGLDQSWLDFFQAF